MRNILWRTTFSVLLLLATSAKSIQKLSFQEEDIEDIHFTFQYDGAYAENLRSQYNLEELVSGCSTNLEKILKVTDWVHHLWEHNGDTTPKQSDPLSILKEVFEEKKQFRCVEYSIVVNGCLNALGIPGRIVGLRTADVETRDYGAGHVVTEAYLVSLNKWIMIDAQFNIIPILESIPLNAIELQQAFSEGGAVSFLSLDDLTPMNTYVDSYRNFIEQYLYYFQTKLVHSYTPVKDAYSLMLVPAGANKPTIFQKIHPLINIYYTHSLNCFYQKPKDLFVKSDFSEIKIEPMQEKYIDAVLGGYIEVYCRYDKIDSW